MYQSITIDQLRSKMKNEAVNLIDIREEFEYRYGYAKGAVNVPMNDLANNASKHMNKNQTYYLICQSGGRSQAVVNYLSLQGYHVVDVLGGHNEWPEQLVRP